MNTSVDLLWTLVVLALILLVILSIVFMIQYSNALPVTIHPSTGKCVVPPESVPNISDELCCYTGTLKTASKYVSSLDLVVNPVATPYLPVCQGFCDQGVLTDGLTCVNRVGQGEFDNCMKISAPVGCQGLSLPVAYSGTTPYYPFAATEASCQIKGRC